MSLIQMAVYLIIYTAVVQTVNLVINIKTWRK